MGLESSESFDRRILLVDDNEAIHQDYRKILESGLEQDEDFAEMAADLFGDETVETVAFNYEIDSAFQGAEALEMLKDARAKGKPYSLVFLDMRMPPGWDGIATARKLWEEDPTVQIVFCTAYSDHPWDEVLSDFEHSDCMLILKKPFDSVEVKQLANALTTKRELARQVKQQLEHLEDMVEQRTASLKAANVSLKEEMAVREQTQATLRDREKQLVAAQKMEAVGVLAAGVAHEFNNLVQTIQGYARFAQEELAPDCQAYEDIGEAIKAAEHASALTNQLLGFSRQQAMQFSSLAVGSLMPDLASMLRPLLGENINLNSIVDENVPSIMADSTMLQQVMMNLCINARDAMPDGGNLTIATKLTADLETVSISITDTGTGISPEIKDRIFEPFFTTKGVGKGTGLGLSMVYGIVEQHHGTIEVDSELGKGTTFRLMLPTEQSLNKGPKEKVSITNTTGIRDATAELAKSAKEVTVLVAEDDPTVRDITVRFLENAGYKAIVANDGQEAIDLFKEDPNRPSLALLDIMMPQKDGHSVYEEMCAIRPDLPVIFCTGYDPNAIKRGPEQASQQEAGWLLVRKPFAPTELLDAIRDELEQQTTSQPHPSEQQDSNGSICMDTP